MNVLFSPSHGGGRSHYCRASLGVPFRVAKGDSGRVVGYISRALFHKAVRKLRTTLRTTGDQFLCLMNENLMSVVTKNMYQSCVKTFVTLRAAL